MLQQRRWRRETDWWWWCNGWRKLERIKSMDEDVMVKKENLIVDSVPGIKDGLPAAPED